MRKKLAVFCDGTWNDLRMKDRTNVSRLAKCVAPASGPVPQIVFYDEGVGVGANISKAADELMKLWGGAFGRGLDRKIEAAYRFLVLNYEPEDDIYIFGFSRGAYTARSLCGLIRKCGILKRDCFDQIPQAMELYRNGVHPADRAMIDFRKAHAHPGMVTGPEMEGDGGHAVWHEGRASGDDLADLFQYRPRNAYSLMFLGLWDTVGSMGVPDRFNLLQVFNRKYDFHDTAASGLITSLRHAVAVDEDRKVFSSTPVKNVDDLNDEWGKARGYDCRNPAAGNFVPYEWRPYQQLWFPGDHGAVGGGNPQLGLSSRTLLWIAEGAQRAGLAIDPAAEELTDADRRQNHLADWRIDKDGNLRKAKGGGLLGDVGGYAERGGPAHAEEVSDFARLRWCDDPAYRPRTLNVLNGKPCPPPGPAPRPSGFPAA